MKVISEFFQRGQAGRKNAPMLAWETVHGKPYPGFKSGRVPNAKERSWNGIMVDTELKNEWLEALNNISQITVRSSCQGHKPEGEWPSFIIIRLKNESKVNKVVKQLHDGKFTFCKAERGPQGFMRVCIATPLYAKGSKHNLWEKWWSTLPARIQKAVN